MMLNKTLRNSAVNFALLCGLMLTAKDAELCKVTRSKFKNMGIEA